MPKRWGNKLPKIKLPLTKSHLQAMRGLTQFERCWTIIDSHLELYKRLESKNKPKQAIPASVKTEAIPAKVTILRKGVHDAKQ